VIVRAWLKALWADQYGTIIGLGVALFVLAVCL